MSGFDDGPVGTQESRLWMGFGNMLDGQSLQSFQILADDMPRGEPVRDIEKPTGIGHGDVLDECARFVQRNHQPGTPAALDRGETEIGELFW